MVTTSQARLKGAMAPSRDFPFLQSAFESAVVSEWREQGTDC